MTSTSTSHDGDDMKVRQAMVRALTHQMNQSERHHRHNMSSQEALAADAKQFAERSDQGHHAICSMLDGVSDQISEGHELMATKADLLALQKQMTRIEEHLIKFDHVVIPREESSTFDPEDEFFNG